MKLSPGVFVYVLGLVIIASQPSRFWLGLARAVIPVVLSAISAAFKRPSPGRSA